MQVGLSGGGKNTFGEQVRRALAGCAIALVVLGLAASDSFALPPTSLTIAPINPEFTAWQSKAATFGLELQDAEGHALGLVPSPIDRSHLLTQTRTPVVQLEGIPQAAMTSGLMDTSLQSRTNLIVAPVGLSPRMGLLRVGY